MELKSMKVSKKKEMEVAEPMKDESPRYPYGLSVNLDNDSFDKLGISMPKTGDKMTLMAKVKVTNTHESSSEGGRKHRNATLQITDMALGPEEKPKSAEKILYGDK